MALLDSIFFILQKTVRGNKEIFKFIFEWQGVEDTKALIKYERLFKVKRMRRGTIRNLLQPISEIVTTWGLVGVVAKMFFSAIYYHFT